MTLWTRADGQVRLLEHLDGPPASVEPESVWERRLDGLMDRLDALRDLLDAHLPGWRWVGLPWALLTVLVAAGVRLGYLLT